MKFTQFGLLLETFLEVKTASQQFPEKYFTSICYCRLENSTKFAEKLSKIRQKSAKIILREDNSFQGKPFRKIWHKRPKLSCSQKCGTQPITYKMSRVLKAFFYFNEKITKT